MTVAPAPPAAPAYGVPHALVPGAPRTPLPYGLFSVVPFRPEGDGRWQSGVQWEYETCAPAGLIGPWSCDPDSPTSGLPKSLDRQGPGVGQASPFTVYGHYNCSAISASFTDAQAHAEQHLTHREEQAVEFEFWGGPGTAGSDPNLYDSTDNVILDGAPQPLALGLGYLEWVIGTQYGSQGVIHLTRGMALMAAGMGYLEARAGKLTTELGTPVIAGSGYGGTGPAGHDGGTGYGQSWAYATPAIFGYRSDIFTSSATPGDLMDRGHNDMNAIAERSYLLGFDPCGVAAVLLDGANPEGIAPVTGPTVTRVDPNRAPADTSTHYTISGGNLAAPEQGTHQEDKK